MSKKCKCLNIYGCRCLSSCNCWYDSTSKMKDVCMCCKMYSFQKQSQNNMMLYSKTIDKQVDDPLQYIKDVVIETPSDDYTLITFKNQKDENYKSVNIPKNNEYTITINKESLGNGATKYTFNLLKESVVCSSGAIEINIPTDHTHTLDYEPKNSMLYINNNNGKEHEIQLTINKELNLKDVVYKLQKYISKIKLYKKNKKIYYNLEFSNEKTYYKSSISNLVYIKNGSNVKVLEFENIIIENDYLLGEQDVFLNDFIITENKIIYYYGVLFNSINNIIENEIYDVDYGSDIYIKNGFNKTIPMNNKLIKI